MTIMQQQANIWIRIAKRLHTTPDIIGMIWVESGHAKKWREKHA